jgi:hypothetical protein
MKWYAPGQETFTKGEGGWVITAPNGKTEVEGVDYIKTYYSLRVTACNACQPIALSLCTPDEIASLGTPWAGGKTCRPYTYDATKLLYLDEAVPYFQGWPERIPPVPPDPENHLIYSFYESGQAEVIKFGSDDRGSYFLWKAYTEWGSYPPTDITFSRTGLGYLLLKAFIRFEGRDLCKTQSVIKVDCCLKDIEHRSVEIWWEDFGTCQPFIIYPGVAYNSICKMPTSVPIGGISGLVWYGAMPPYQPLYSIPEILGSCLPVEWTFTGPITFRGNSKKNDNAIFFQFTSEVECFTEVGIILRDRCGNEYSIRGSPCCEDAGPLYISYTSLLMSCGGQQTLTGGGGCGPYTWSASTGSLSETQGSDTVYTAPATNANCTDNPTITVTDCCGNSASISLAVNCYVDGYSLGMNDRDAVGACNCAGACVIYWPTNFCATSADYSSLRMRKWNCDGTLTYSCSTGTGGTHNIEGEGCGRAYCPPGTSWGPLDPMYCAPVELGGCLSGFHCGTSQCGNSGGNCSELVDERTLTLKEQGCCPLNPLTGLPY